MSSLWALVATSPAKVAGVQTVQYPAVLVELDSS